MEKLKVYIFTSSNYGSSTYIIEQIIKFNPELISGIIYCQNSIKVAKKNQVKRIVKKVLNIGILGAINGVRMRKWYSSHLNSILQPSNLDFIVDKYNIPLIVVPDSRSNTTSFIIKELACDLGVSIGNSYISEIVFKSFKKGMINLHGELLPQYQNAQSVIWQLFNNSSKTGLTIHQIEKKIDTGRILYKRIIDIKFDKEISKTVSNTCAIITKNAADSIIKVVLNYDNLFKDGLEQKDGSKYTTPSIWQFIRILNNHRKLRLKG